MANKLAEEMEEARKEKKRLDNEKRELAAEKQLAKERHEQLLVAKENAQRELDEAKALLLKKKEMAKKLQK